MASLTIGKPAPDFTLPVIGEGYQPGETLRLSQVRGQTVVLYFYPKDDTPGCTTQACALRDGWTALPEGALVFGVSVDSLDSHQKFIDKYQLPFPLFSDTEKEVVQLYGVWVEKSMYGKKYMGVERSTFVIDPAGNLHAILKKVKPAEHLSQLLKSLP
ncbi:MAG: peroxiredoxin [Verrucomicrobiales bacterium]